MNVWHGMGRTTSEPSVQTINKNDGSGSFLKAYFDIGMNDWRTKKSTYIPCIAYGSIAERVKKIPKGTKLIIHGELDSYRGKDGRSTIAVVVNDFEYAEKKKTDLADAGFNLINFPITVEA